MILIKSNYHHYRDQPSLVGLFLQTWYGQLSVSAVMGIGAVVLFSLSVPGIT